MFMQNQIEPIIISGEKPFKWIRASLRHNNTEQFFEVFRSDSKSEYHLEIFNKLQEELVDHPIEVIEICDAGRIDLVGPTICHLFGYSSYFKIPSPDLDPNMQQTIREQSKQTLETHGYVVNLGAIWE